MGRKSLESRKGGMTSKQYQHARAMGRTEVFPGLLRNHVRGKHNEHAKITPRRAGSAAWRSTEENALQLTLSKRVSGFLQLICIWSRGQTPSSMLEGHEARRQCQPQACRLREKPFHTASLCSRSLAPASRISASLSVAECVHTCMFLIRALGFAFVLLTNFLAKARGLPPPTHSPERARELPTGQGLQAERCLLRGPRSRQLLHTPTPHMAGEMRTPSQQEPELYRAWGRGSGLQSQAAEAPTMKAELPSERSAAPRCSPSKLERQDQQHACEDQGGRGTQGSLPSLPA